MRRTAALLVTMAVALVMGAGVAYSHDHVPPKTLLKKGEQQLQRGNLVSYCWTRPTDDGGFVTYCGDSLQPNYPTTDYVKAGSRLHIRIFKTQRPESFRVTAYEKVDKSGRPTGTGQQLSTSLRPVQEDGTTVAWDVFFEVDSPGHHYYMTAFGSWKDVQGSDRNQNASWTFHVKTKG